MSKLLSLREVSEALGLHIDTVRRYAREGRIQAAKFGRVYRVREEALEEFIKRQENTVTGTEEKGN